MMVCSCTAIPSKTSSMKICAFQFPSLSSRCMGSGLPENNPLKHFKDKLVQYICTSKCRHGSSQRHLGGNRRQTIYTSNHISFGPGGKRSLPMLESIPAEALYTLLGGATLEGAPLTMVEDSSYSRRQSAP